MSKKEYTFITEFTLVFLVLALLPSLYFLKAESRVSEQVEQNVKQQTQSQIAFSQRALTGNYQAFSQTFNRLAHNGFVHNALQTPSSNTLKMVEDVWLLAIRNQSLYTNIRLLDEHGNELVGINNHNGYSIVVAQTQLENQSHTTFFQKAQQIKPGDSSLHALKADDSPTTNNRGPLLQVITPIDFMLERKGYVLVNLQFSHLLESAMFSQQGATRPDVVADDGLNLFIHQPNTTELNAGLNPLSIRSPLLWHAMQQKAMGIVYEHGFWTMFHQVKLDQFSPDITLYLYESVGANDLAPLIKSEVSDLKIQATGIYTLIFMMSLGFVVWHAHHEKNSLDSRIARATMNGISAVIITDRANRIVSINDEFTKLSGFSLQEVKGRRPYMFAASKYPQELYIQIWKTLKRRGLWQGEVVNVKKDGSLLTQIMRIQSVKDSNDTVQFYVSSFVDISERKELELRLRDLSEKDTLCNLWNRRKFDTQLDDHCQRVKRYPEKETTCLALFDVDNFKNVNDEFGHDEGDKTLLYIAQMLSKHSRKADFAARIGGEEFALMMPYTDLETACRVVDRIRRVIQDNYVRETTVSVGVTQLCVSSAHSYKRADQALYHSKQNGRNKVTSIENETHLVTEQSQILSA